MDDSSLVSIHAPGTQENTTLSDRDLVLSVIPPGCPCYHRVNNIYTCSLPEPVWTLVFVTRYEQILDKVLTDMKRLLNKLGRYEEAVQTEL